MKHDRQLHEVLTLRLEAGTLTALDAVLRPGETRSEAARAMIEAGIAGRRKAVPLTNAEDAPYA